MIAKALKREVAWDKAIKMAERFSEYELSRIYHKVKGRSA
jgi:hypothetical protein